MRLFPQPGTVAFDEEVASAAAQLALDQTEVNEALVQKILQCERAELALRASEHQLHALLAHQLSTREEERRRISREIHDSLGQNLLALRLDVAALHEQTGQRQARLHGWTGAALDNLDLTIRSVRQLIADLRPFELELGLQAAIDWEANKFRRTSGIACTVEGNAALADLQLDDVRLLAIYRALQECLDNVARHAEASTVHIELGLDDDILHLNVTDNGIGLGFTVPPASAFGLLGIQERLQAAGGGIALGVASPHGTRVSLTMPVSHQNVYSRSRVLG